LTSFNTSKLGEPFGNILREFARTLARPLFPPSKYLNQPVSAWPPILGAVHELRLPRRTPPHPSPSPTGASNINILLAMVDRTLSIDGDVAECGVFRGSSLVPMAVHLKQRAPGKRLLGFDSFAGYDNSILLDLSLDAPSEASKRPGAFSNTSASAVLNKLCRFHADNVTLIPGYFHDSLPKCADRRFSFVHLDLGIYQAYKECLEFFYPRLHPGGVILSNDYNKPAWPGCKKAVDEFLTGKPEKLQMLEMDNYQRFYISKLIAS
jgi:O-methyltransferase